MSEIRKRLNSTIRYDDLHDNDAERATGDDARRLVDGIASVELAEHVGRT